jgi:predicted permease
MGNPLIAGREFTRADTATSPRVAIVNETFVRHFLPSRNPIGMRAGRGTGDNVKLDTEIVGVVKDALYSSLRQAPPRVFYTPYTQTTRQGGFYFYLRTGIEPSAVAGLVRREVAALDPYLPVRDLKTMEQQLEEQVFVERLFSALTGSFAGLATLLAAIGMYGVLAYNVARRTREIGVRMALGAPAGRVRGLVLRETSWMLGVGTAFGLASAAALGRLVQAMLFGLEPWDPAIYSGAAVALGAIALFAAYIPARRATRVDPVVALRHE